MTDRLPSRPARSRGPRRCRRAAAPAPAPPAGCQPDAGHGRRTRWSSARLVLDGILNNDLFIVAQPEYRAGVEARCNALLESMVRVQAAAAGTAARERVPHADLPAGDRASEGDAEAGYSGDLER